MLIEERADRFFARFVLLLYRPPARSSEWPAALPRELAPMRRSTWRWWLARGKDEENVTTDPPNVALLRISDDLVNRFTDEEMRTEEPCDSDTCRYCPTGWFECDDSCTGYERP